MKKYVVNLELKDCYKTIELDNLLSVIGFVIFAKLNKTTNNYTITKRWKELKKWF